MGEIVQHVDVLMANEEDCQHALGIASEVDVESGALDPARYRALAEKVLAAYPARGPHRHHASGEQVGRRQRLVRRPA